MLFKEELCMYTLVLCWENKRSFFLSFFLSSYLQWLESAVLEVGPAAAWLREGTRTGARAETPAPRYGTPARRERVRRRHAANPWRGRRSRTDRRPRWGWGSAAWAPSRSVTVQKMSKQLCKHVECSAYLKFLLIFTEAFFYIFTIQDARHIPKKKDNNLGYSCVYISWWKLEIRGCCGGLAL